MKVENECAALVDISLIVRLFIRKALFDVGCLLRGGISFGELHLGKNSILGPALIRAYEIESSEAIYPRVIIDSSLEMLFKNCTDENVHNSFYSIFQYDFDNRLYVRYSLTDLIYNHENFKYTISSIDDLLHRMLIKAKNQSVIQKYAWWVNAMNKELEKEGISERLTNIRIT